ncbi:unnamed protein product [Lampetra planeri]
MLLQFRLILVSRVLTWATDSTAPRTVVDGDCERPFSRRDQTVAFAPRERNDAVSVRQAPASAGDGKVGIVYRRVRPDLRLRAEPSLRPDAVQQPYLRRCDADPEDNVGPTTTVTRPLRSQIYDDDDTMVWVPTPMLGSGGLALRIKQSHISTRMAPFLPPASTGEADEEQGSVS